MINCSDMTEYLLFHYQFRMFIEIMYVIIDYLHINCLVKLIRVNLLPVSEAGSLNKSSCLAPALGVTKFIIV
jgi:hypothetical protein